MIEKSRYISFLVNRKFYAYRAKTALFYVHRCMLYIFSCAV